MALNNVDDTSSTLHNVTKDFDMVAKVTVADFISLLIYSFTFLLGLPANLLVLGVYTRKACKRGATPNVVYALNLCLANLALVAWLPVKALEVVLQRWALPPTLCLVYNFFLFASLYGSCLFLTAVAVGRYLSAAFPISYKLYRRARLSCGVSAALWALVLIHLGLGLAAEGGAYFTHTSTYNNTSTCFQNFTAEQHAVLLPLRLEMALLLFLLPLSITAFCTLRCVALVRHSCLPAGRKRRVVAVTFSTLAVFVVCYGPYNLSHVVGFVMRDTVGWRSEAMLTSSCNVFLEPAVMLMLSPSRLPGLAGRLCRRAAGPGRATSATH
ncbi:free fatty acid receptor 1 [Megalops cyprinoides]|uniref:free fatty acid receptor 1 n=1 Tax=Megalops cyprinoides TaxID=118141 RepID=UPI0018644378|nr:free fatty acid receptor 1 [Megalops cyprinoides]